MKAVISLAKVIDAKSLAISALAVLVTWLCLKFKITADFPLTLIATAIVFPLVFSINAAYRRRDSALEEYASLKAHSRALYLAARDWLPHYEDPGRTGSIKGTIDALLRACRTLFTSPIVELETHEPAVYREMSNISLFILRLREEGLAPNEVSRCNQYLSRIALSFEKLKHIFEYRTPRTLRAFSGFFIYLLPIVYGPYFAFQAAEYGTALVYVMPVLFVLILVGLSNIQDDLENPFDQIGEDDVAINVEKFVGSLEVNGSSVPTRSHDATAQPTSEDPGER